jgi:hypothetical protein
MDWWWEGRRYGRGGPFAVSFKSYALGHYQKYMKQMLREHLPEFTPEELKVVKESSDFYGVNTYTTKLCSTFMLFA